MDERTEWQKRMGVGEPSRLFLRHQGQSQTKPVVREEGSRRGTVGGSKTEHWDGRVDATVRPEPTKVTISRSERRVVNVES